MILTGTSSPEEAAEALGRFVSVAVVGIGERGAVAVVDGRRVLIAGFEVGATVDPTGTSDLFVAAWAWGDANGMELEDSLRWASLYAALSVRVPTGAAGATSLGELMEEGSRRGLPLPPA
jgi:sugar/nucleoside kinase (ribokinase family)